MRLALPRFLPVLSVLSVLCHAGELSVPNASFEEAADAGALHWHWWSRTKTGSAVRTADDHHSLGHSMCIRYERERDWAFSSDHRFPARPGQAYLAMAWVRVKTGHVALAVVALSGGRTLSWDIGSSGADAKDKWVKAEAVADVPNGCDQIYVRFVGEGETLAWVDDVSLQPIEPPKPAEKPRIEGYATERIREPLDRGLVALPRPGGKVHVAWRLLDTDPPDIAFDLLRAAPGTGFHTLNAQPLRTTTDWLDTTAAAGTTYTYFVQPAGAVQPLRPTLEVRASEKGSDYISIRLQGDHTFQKVGIGDLDADGRYDFVIKQPNANIDPWHLYWTRSPDTYKLEAYRGDGKFLWRHDLGWAIERGIWYSPYVVFDLDGDGKAEVAVKTGEGDPRDAEGKVQSGPEHLTILDGSTGKPLARVDWPAREAFTGPHAYNYASRNQLGVAYLDGKTPCLIVERGTYNVITVVAYEFHVGKLRELWRWCNADRGVARRYWGQGAHWMHAADVDADGRDEVLIGSAVLDDNGAELWSTGLGHPDHFYVGDIDPLRPGLEIYYGIEPGRPRNTMCLVDARTGRILWGHQEPTRHIHASGLCSDIDPSHPGAECYSGERDLKDKRWLRDCEGKVLGHDLGDLSPRAAYWDADPQRELLRRGRISDYGAKESIPPRIEGHVAAVADILGDWREEIITSVPGELRIYTTTVPASGRRPCLMHDPIYRIDVAHAAMGYFQVPMLSIDLATEKR